MGSPTSEVLADEYLTWLGGKIARSTRHLELLAMLHNKEFVWLVANDDNRIEDALDLRRDFLRDTRFRTQAFEHFRHHYPTVLEVLIGLSRRLEFEATGMAEVWAWRLIENLELHKMKDPLTPRKREQIEDMLDTLIFRTYKSNGVGGFFPLAFSEQDQTQVEIWYQMSAYIEENELP